MLIVRPVSINDFQNIVDFSQYATIGFTSLPQNPDILKSRIQNVHQSFSTTLKKPDDSFFLFVLEDLKNKQIVGTSGLMPKIGKSQPLYTYELKKSIKSIASPLAIRQELSYLQLKFEESGLSELSTLLIHPNYRGAGRGSLLSLSRFLFMAEYRHCFESVVVAEMRGVFQHDISPFWEHFAKHFFAGISFDQIDQARLVDKSFINQLIPKTPIYLHCLPQKVTKVIAEVHPDTRPARTLLEKEGFIFANEIDPLDGGPLFAATLDDIRTVRDSQTAILENIAAPDNAEPVFMISTTNRSLQDFRACMSPLNISRSGTLSIPAAAAEGLEVKPGHRIRYAVLYSKEKKKIDQ